jgi:hypothetical protein
MSSYLHLPNGTTWPDPDAVEELAWAMRYTPTQLTQQEYAVAASVIDAYVHLVRAPGAADALRRALRSRREDADTP